MKKYLKIYLQLLLFSTKSKLSFRFNLVFKLLYGPAYVGVLLTILLITYSKTSTLAGWNKNDALLLFAVFNMIYATCLIAFIDSMRYLLWDGIRLGEVDGWLMKPGNIQFFLTFSRPNLDLISLWIFVVVFFVYKMITLHSVSVLNIIGFWILFVLAHVIVYLVLSIYSTLGFYVTRAQQVLEVFDKAADFAQYPLTIFPQSLQLLLSTFIPLAFFSYIPTLFLKNEGSILLVISSITLTVTLFAINHFAWKNALRHYSSASS